MVHNDLNLFRAHSPYVPESLSPPWSVFAQGFNKQAYCWFIDPSHIALRLYLPYTDHRIPNNHNTFVEVHQHNLQAWAWPINTDGKAMSIGMILGKMVRIISIVIPWTILCGIGFVCSWKCHKAGIKIRDMKTKIEWWRKRYRDVSQWILAWWVLLRLEITISTRLGFGIQRIREEIARVNNKYLLTF